MFDFYLFNVIKQTGFSSSVTRNAHINSVLKTASIYCNRSFTRRKEKKNF